MRGLFRPTSGIVFKKDFLEGTEKLMFFSFKDCQILFQLSNLLLCFVQSKSFLLLFVLPFQFLLSLVLEIQPNMMI